MVASASEGRVVVTLGGYREPSGDRVHQLWLARPGAGTRSPGLLDAGVPLYASRPNRSATSLAVTVGPDGQPARPTSKPVAQLALESAGFGE
ncbi:hypothetical protein GCM10022384_48380 [Streptomyces marokkonensis]|uniref:Anti-sigma K factor RskA C-terminal domain-containing protein n=1 Tax=Streptomyces marokkonensis TaxID=324855 RepID=A0ABP7RBP2_9ACTN